RGGVDLRAGPVLVRGRRVVLTQGGGAGISRLQGQVGRALPVGGIELDADVAIPLILVRVEVIAGEGEPAAKVELERRVGRLALALGAEVVEADVLAAHEDAVRLSVTVDVDT